MPADEASVNPPGAGDEAVEAVAREAEVEAVAIAIQRELNGSRTVYLRDLWVREMAEAAIAALDRVRSRPDSGTENEGHDHSWQCVWRCRHCGLVQPAPPPVSGTEPDTAKLVEAARTFMVETPTVHPAVGAVSVSDPAPRRYDAARQALVKALAAFSVDAGNTKEKR